MSLILFLIVQNLSAVQGERGISPGYQPWLWLFLAFNSQRFANNLDRIKGVHSGKAA